MENPSEKQETPKPCCCSTGSEEQKAATACCPFRNINYKFIFERAKDVLLNPKGCWKAIKEDGRSEKQTCYDYLMVLAAIPAIFGFIKSWAIGISIPFLGSWNMPFFGGLIYYIAMYAQIIIMTWLFAFILQKVAPKFAVSAEPNATFKLVAYSMTPSMLAGVFVLFGADIGGFICFVAGIYGLYLMYVGLDEMTNTPKENKVKYAIVSLVIAIIVSAVLAFLVKSVFMPQPPTENLPFSGGRVQFNLNQ